jgi:hypothetical protein
MVFSVGVDIGVNIDGLGSIQQASERGRLRLLFDLRKALPRGIDDQCKPLGGFQLR